MQGHAGSNPKLVFESDDKIASSDYQSSHDSKKSICESNDANQTCNEAKRK